MKVRDTHVLQDRASCTKCGEEMRSSGRGVFATVAEISLFVREHTNCRGVESRETKSLIDDIAEDFDL